MDNALDVGISEFDFWNMTLAELERLFDSKRRVQKVEAQEKATFDYILADLVGKSISRIYSSANTYPEINEVYPSLFDTTEMKEKRAEQKAKLSALRFEQFANSYNMKYNKEVAKDK